MVARLKLKEIDGRAPQGVSTQLLRAKKMTSDRPELWNPALAPAKKVIRSTSDLMCNTPRLREISKGDKYFQGLERYLHSNNFVSRS